MKQSMSFDFKSSNASIPMPIMQQVMRGLRVLEGKDVRITVEEIKRRRSDKQNRYYWGCLIPMVTEMFLDAGNTIDGEQVHEFLKEHVGALKDTISDPNGVIHTVVRSSTKLTTAEWENYMERIRAWAADFGLLIPTPNETEFWEGV